MDFNLPPELVAYLAELDSFIVERCTIKLTRESRIAVDGELVSLGTSLAYSVNRDAIQVICP